MIKNKLGKPISQRQLRVGEELRHALSDVFGRGVLRDPDIMDRSVTVTEVRPSPDLKNATVYVMPLGGADIDSLLKRMPLEERLYRHRCVEAWSMTVPWVGIPLASILARAQPTPRARYVTFESFFDVSQAPRQANDSYPWPYREGVTIGEAMNPLTFVALGMYGRFLQPQNGAPVRIVVPWKYGFKGPKSVVKMTLTATRPESFWHTLQPTEYGFTANVDPTVPHPRWSQAHEIEIGSWGRRRPTLKFNGYGDWVAHLYQR